jgi:hypothetical protein
MNLETTLIAHIQELDNLDMKVMKTWLKEKDIDEQESLLQMSDTINQARKKLISKLEAYRVSHYVNSL